MLKDFFVIYDALSEGKQPALEPPKPYGDYITWLAQQGSWTPELIDQASQRFDLSPIDEEFLLQESRRFQQQNMPPANNR